MLKRFFLSLFKKKKSCNKGNVSDLSVTAKSQTNAIKLHQCEILIFDYMLNFDLEKTLMESSAIKRWAYILHDKDDALPHYHIYLDFGGASVDTKIIAKWFQLGYTDKDGNEQTGERFITKIKGRVADVLLYFTHENETQRYKNIYDRCEVHANFDFESEIAALIKNNRSLRNG